MALNPQNLIPGANKNGRPRITDDERAAREFYRQNEVEIVKLQQLPIKDLFELAKDQTQPFWKMDAAKKLIAQYKSDRYDFTESRKNRMLGAPKQQVDVDANLNHTITPKESVKEMLKELVDESNRSE